LDHRDNLDTKDLVLITQKLEETKGFEVAKEQMVKEDLRVTKENLETRGLVETRGIRVTSQIRDTLEIKDFLESRATQTRLEDHRAKKDILVCLDYRVHRVTKENRVTKAIYVVTKVHRVKEDIKVHCHF
jgi:hypothetical protein